jgi:hypothetical protein
MVANTARDPKRHRKPFQPADFMPDPEPQEEKKALSWEELKAKSSAIFRAFGGKVKP